MTRLPALSVIGTPTKRTALLEVAAEADRRGFAGLASPGINGNLALCGSLAHVTHTIPFWTSIQPIYHSHHGEVAITAGHIAEVSNGRFRLGLGVSHVPAMDRLGIHTGKPLGDMRTYIAGIRSASRASGTLPPIVLATLRRRMVQLSGEIADGCVWANGSQSHMQASLAALPDEKRNDPAFFIGNMIPTCISDDREAAAAVMRRTLTSYVMLPNYRNYWIEAGYEEEMRAIEAAHAAGDTEKIPSLMSDRWLSDCTLFGAAAQVREGVEAWQAAGVRTPILVPSSAAGNQLRAFQELFATFG